MSAPALTAPASHNVWRQVPNVLTVFRIVLVPILIWAIAEDPTGSALAVTIFVVAAVTDGMRPDEGASPSRRRGTSIPVTGRPAVLRPRRRGRPDTQARPTAGSPWRGR